MREVYDDSPSTAGQKRTREQVSKNPQLSKTTTADIALAELHAPPEVSEDEKEEPTAGPEDDEEMQREPSDTKETPEECRAQAEARSAHKIQENMSVKTRVMMKSPKRPDTPVSLSDDLFGENRLEQRRRTDASGNRRCGSAEHGGHIPRRREG